MPALSGLQPRWGRSIGGLFVVVILIALTRGAWEIVIGTAMVALLAGGYLLRRHARRRSVYDGSSTYEHQRG